MATDYIKVSRFAARKMGLDSCRGTFADGNFILWEKDLHLADPDWAFHPDETIAAIGGLRLNPWEARKEQQQTTPENCRPLPVPTDPAWQDPDAKPAPKDEPRNPDPEQQAEPAAEQEPPQAEQEGEEADPESEDLEKRTAESNPENTEESE